MNRMGCETLNRLEKHLLSMYEMAGGVSKVDDCGIIFDGGWNKASEWKKATWPSQLPKVFTAGHSTS